MLLMKTLRRAQTPGMSVISDGAMRIVTCASLGSTALIAAAAQSLIRYCSSI